jgi:hypothetical protein
VVDAEKAKNIYMEKNSKWINFLWFFFKRFSSYF